LEYGTLLISKVIDANDPSAFARLGVTESDFPTKAEKDAYKFITDYAERNRNSAPSYAAVTAEVPDFYYVPEVSDAYSHLVGKIKDHAIKLALIDYVPKLNEKFDAGADGKELLEDLRKNIESIEARTQTRDKVGTDLLTVRDKFLAEYERRKAGESFRLWKSNYSAIGEYVSSNVYTIYGKSGRGKSIIALEEAIAAALAGANVLLWTLEMGWYEVWVRIFVSVSGRQGVTTAHSHGMDLTAGFDSSEVRNGKLSEEFETAFQFFVDTVNEQIDGNITVRAVDDEDFINRGLRELEADIQTTKADFVVIDPFYYLDYERNTSKTAGGDSANTSIMFRRLAGRTHAVGLAITQADETKGDEDEEGNRELALPNREDVKKTKQLLEDAYMLIGVDTDYKQGRGLVGVSKGRSGGEGNETEILYIPQVGVIREMVVGEEVADQFIF